MQQQPLLQSVNVFRNKIVEQILQKLNSDLKVFVRLKETIGQKENINNILPDLPKTFWGILEQLVDYQKTIETYFNNIRQLENLLPASVNENLQETSIEMDLETLDNNLGILSEKSNIILINVDSFSAIIDKCLDSLTWVNLSDNQLSLNCKISYKMLFIILRTYYFKNDLKISEVFYILEILFKIELVFPPEKQIKNNTITHVRTHAKKNKKLATKQIVYIFRSLVCAIFLKYDRLGVSWPNIFEQHNDHNFNQITLTRFLKYFNKYKQDNQAFLLRNQQKKNQ